MLTLLPFPRLQQAQKLRVVGNSMGRSQVSWGILAVQPAINAAPHKAHDVLGQSACTRGNRVQAAHRLYALLQHLSLVHMVCSTSMLCIARALANATCALKGLLVDSPSQEQCL